MKQHFRLLFLLGFTNRATGGSGKGRMDCNLAAIKWFFAFHSGLRYDFNLFHFCLVESVLKWCKAIIYGHFYVVSLWLFGSLIIIDGSRERASERVRERESEREYVEAIAGDVYKTEGTALSRMRAGKGTWPQCIFDRDGKIFRIKWNGNGTIGSKMKIVCMSWHGANGLLRLAIQNLHGNPRLKKNT